jgi:hypothetical protein
MVESVEASSERNRKEIFQKHIKGCIPDIEDGK